MITLTPKVEEALKTAVYDASIATTSYTDKGVTTVAVKMSDIEGLETDVKKFFPANTNEYFVAVMSDYATHGYTEASLHMADSIAQSILADMAEYAEV